MRTKSPLAHDERLAHLIHTGNQQVVGPDIVVAERISAQGRAGPTGERRKFGELFRRRPTYAVRPVPLPAGEGSEGTQRRPASSGTTSASRHRPVMTCGIPGPPAFAKTRRPLVRWSTPAYDPVKPDPTGGSAACTGAPAKRAISARTGSGSAAKTGRAEVRV